MKSKQKTLLLSFLLLGTMTVLITVFLTCYYSFIGIEGLIEERRISELRLILKIPFVGQFSNKSIQKNFLKVCDEGDLMATRAFLDSSLIEPGIRSEYNNFSPLHLAASEGNFEICKLLINDGFLVNSRNVDGFTPLHYAVNHTIAELFLSNGADINVQSYTGYTPLHVAAQDGNLEMLRFLIDQGAKISSTRIGSPLHVYNDESVFSLLVDENADINALDQEGDTPLHVAASEGDLQVVTLLLKMGAKKVPNKEGLTAAFYAKELGYDDIVNLLEE